MIKSTKYDARVSLVAMALVACSAAGLPGLAHAGPEDLVIVRAKEAQRVNSRPRLEAARDEALAQGHALASWADFWALRAKLPQATVAEVDEFLARWPQAYVADRLRNDWLLELGKRGDWATFLRVQPSFQMNDDREVNCYGWLARQQTSGTNPMGAELAEQARQAWWAQAKPDTACHAMAQALHGARVLNDADVWHKMRLALAGGQPAAAQQAARLMGEATNQAVARLIADPKLYLLAPTPATQAPPRQRGRAAAVVPRPLPVPDAAKAPLTLLAFARWAAVDPAPASGAWAARTGEAEAGGPEEQAWVWAQMGRFAAGRLLPEAPENYRRALRTLERPADSLARWHEDTLAWMARAGLRSAVAGDLGSWALVERAIDAMPPGMQQDPVWVYWKARALMAKPVEGRIAQAMNPRVAPEASAEPVTPQEQGRALMQSLIGGLDFYSLVAAEDLTGKPAPVPAKVDAPTAAELRQVRALPGIDRSLRLFDLGWRSEAVREWNFTLSFGGPGRLNERQVLAAAALACEREIWDRCINTSERTRDSIDLQQRYPTPMRREVVSAAREVGLDPTFMYGLIRQESRFITDARSHVGASGLMQVMPATASWTAKKLGMPFTADQITDPLVNLRLGAGYLKLVLDDFEGSHAMAAAAYNAGPGRPRRWREGPELEVAAWAENIPFTETRGYVQKVISNGVVYAHLMQGRPLSIKSRLGQPIGPRPVVMAAPNKELP